MQFPDSYNQQIPKSSLNQSRKAQLQQQLSTIIKEAARISETLHLFAKQLKYTINEHTQTLIPLKIQCKIQKPTASPICSRIVGQAAAIRTIFKCFDCGQAQNSIQCPQCFCEADHKGHNYIQAATGDGCCDCGNQQMFNVKGFCPSHSKKQIQVNIPHIIRQKFLKEGALWFYIILWLTNRQQRFSLNHIFVKKQTISCMKQLISLSSQNYDIKVLIYQVLTLSLTKTFPNLPEIPYGKLTLLQMVFRVEPYQYLQQFCRLTYELFPIKQLRINIIREYFKKCSDDHNFGFHHPLRLLNFQFLTCIKTINSLLSQRQILPLRLPPPGKILQSEDPDKLILRIVDDLNYPSQMKGARQFHSLCLLHTNISESLLSYRLVPDERIHKVVHDQYFMKTIKYFIKNISKDKKIVQKVLGQLWKSICQISQDSLSLIHERIFSMFLTDYLDGDILILKLTQKHQKIIKILHLDDVEDRKKLLMRLASYHLKNFIRPFYQYYESQIPSDYVYDYFVERNPQLQLPFIYDLTYQKILLLLSNSSINYCQIAGSVIEQVISSKNPLKYKKLFNLISSIHVIVTVDSSSYATQCLIDKVNKQKAFQFYGKFINSFKQLKAIQIKNKVLKVLYNKQLFQNFVKDHCQIEKGYLKPKIDYQQFNYFSHKFFFEKFNINMHGSSNMAFRFTLLPQYQKSYVWSDHLINIMIQVCKQIFGSFDKLINPLYESEFLPSLFAQELIKIYVLTQSILLRQFLCGDFMKIIKQNNTPFLKQIIIDIFKLKQTQKNLYQQIDRQDQKKKKMLNKKKEKQQKFKQMRKKMLEKHNIKDTSLEQNQNVCIFCRETTNQQLKLISSVSLQSILNKAIFKFDSFRLNFRTCGHKVHQKCFFNNLYDIDKVCFLCRRSANILIPDFKNNCFLQKCHQFMDKIYPTLIEYYQDYNEHIIKIFNPQDQTSLIRAIINSLLSQVLLFGSLQYKYIKQHMISATSQLFSLLKVLPKEQIRRAIELDENIICIKNQLLESYDKARTLFCQILEKNWEEVQIKKEQTINKENKQFYILKILAGAILPFNIGQLKIIDPQKYIYILPNCLSELHLQMGKCPSCSIVTDQILLCLTCGWKVCNREKQKFIEHLKLHGNSIFIKCDTGRLIYVFKGHFFIRQSLYVNYLEEPYQSNSLVGKKTSQYKLNYQKYELIKQKIMTNEIYSLALTEIT